MICSQCNKEFILLQSAQKYCSKKCTKIVLAENRRKYQQSEKGKATERKYQQSTKYKKYKKKLDAEFNNKLGILSNSIINQKKYNSLISKAISQMQLDESVEPGGNEDSKKNGSDLEDKLNEQKEQESKESETNAMSLDANLPDLDQQSSEVNSKIEAEEDDKSLNSPKVNREKSKNFGDSKYKY